MSKTIAPPAPPPDPSAPDMPAAAEPAAEAAPQSTEVDLAYAGVSRAVTTPDAAQVALYGNLRREPVRLDASVRDPLRFREALSALYAIVGSDYRYVPKDRAAYAAFVRMRRQTSSMGAWQSQQAYFSWLLRNDPNAPLLLDPVVTVHPDQVMFEVFSKDEGTYAKLGIDLSAFEGGEERSEGRGQRSEKTRPTPSSPTSDLSPLTSSYGTTNIDFSQTLFDGIQQMRSYRHTRLTIGREDVRLVTADAGPRGEALEKRIKVPDSWLRGFLQVQSAAALPLDTFTVAPMDLYNLLRHLRLHADRKGKRRGLRVELVPGEFPRLVLEPWEVVLAATGEPYRGRVPKVVRVWGRRRLMLLRRMLPFVERVDVHLLGSGLPSFWVFRAGDFNLTLGLTGFTSANWSQAVSFDLLLPRKTEQSTKPLESVVAHLKKVWFASANEIGAETGLKGAALLETLQAGCQQGRLMFDLAAGVYRLRPLTDAPLDLNRLEYRNARERIAHDLLVRRGAVKIVSENRIATVGLELTGKVVVDEDKREYRPQMVLADEGQVGKAECTCNFFRKQGLKGGPCEHLIALRLCYADQEAKRAKGAEARQAVLVETRTYSRRDAASGKEDVVQVSLERQKLKLRRGKAGEPMRVQTLRFNTPEDAREAYFRRVEEMERKGYLDATAGAAV